MIRLILCDWLGWHAWQVAKNHEMNNGHVPRYCARCGKYERAK